MSTPVQFFQYDMNKPFMEMWNDSKYQNTDRLGMTRIIWIIHVQDVISHHIVIGIVKSHLFRGAFFYRTGKIRKILGEKSIII